MAEKVNIIKRIGIFLGEIKSELKKVTWPTREDMTKTTIAVVVSSIIFGAYLFLVDTAFHKLITFVIDSLMGK